MKYCYILIAALLLMQNLFAQQELGGLNTVRLHLSSYMIRDNTTSGIPQFDFQSNGDIWQGTELNSTTETADVTEWDAVNVCAQQALGQANQSCYYVVYDTYICGTDSWGFNLYCDRPIWIYDSNCGQSSQQAIIDAIQNGTHSCVTNNTFTYPLARNNRFLRVEAGVNYTLDLTAASGIQIQTAFIAPSGYMVFIQDDSGEFKPSSKAIVDFSTDTKTITFQLREVQTRSPRLIGQSSHLQVGDLKWELGLGVLGNGDSAGRLVFHENDLDDTPYTREALRYYEPITSGTNEIEVIRDAQGQLRQIKAPGSFIDLVDVATSGGKVIRYEIRMYAPLTSGATKMNGLYTPSSQNLLTSYSLGREAGQTLNDFAVKQFNGSGGLLCTDQVTKSANGTTSAGVPLINWLIVTTANSGSHPVSKSVLVDNVAHTQGGTPTGFRLQQVNTGQTKRVYPEEDFNFISQSVYRKLPDAGVGEMGEVKVFEGRLDNTAQGGNQFGGKGFSYYYNTDPAVAESYGQRFLSVDTFGGWKFINFNGNENSLDYGDSYLLLEPGDEPYNPLTFLSSSTIDHDGDPNTPPVAQWVADLTAASNTARYTVATRVNDYDGVSRREAVVTKHLNNSGLASLVPVSQQVSQPSFVEASGEKIEVLCSYSPHDFPSNSNRRGASYTASYTPDTPNRRLIYKPYFVFRPDKTKSSYGYFEGSYRGINNAFVSLWRAPQNLIHLL